MRASGCNVAVVVTDTAGGRGARVRPTTPSGPPGWWSPTLRGRTDAHGNEFAVAQPAVGDEIAGHGPTRPGQSSAVGRSRSCGAAPTWCCRRAARSRSVVAGPGEGGGPVRYPGAREAVVRALRGDPGDQAPFSFPADPAELAAAITDVPASSLRLAPRRRVACHRHVPVAGPGARGAGVRPRLGSSRRTRRAMRPVATARRVDSAVVVQPRPHPASTTREVASWPSPPSPPSPAARRSSMDAQKRRGDPPTQLGDHRGVRCGSRWRSSPPRRPDRQDKHDEGEVQRRRARRHRRTGVLVRRSSPKRPTASRATSGRDPVDYDRTADVRAPTGTRPVSLPRRSRSFYTADDRPPTSRRWCTTLEHGHDPLGTTPIADARAMDQVQAIADKFDATGDLRVSGSLRRHWTSGDGNVRSSPTASTSPSRTGRLAAGERDQAGVLYCSEVELAHQEPCRVPLLGHPSPPDEAASARTGKRADRPARCDASETQSLTRTTAPQAAAHRQDAPTRPASRTRTRHPQTRRTRRLGQVPTRQVSSSAPTP